MGGAQALGSNLGTLEMIASSFTCTVFGGGTTYQRVSKPDDFLIASWGTTVVYHVLCP